MTSFSKFPLFRLPRLALANVFLNFDFCAVLMFLINYPKIRHWKLISHKFGEFYTILVDTHGRFPVISLVRLKSVTQSDSSKSNLTRLVEVRGPITDPEKKNSGSFKIDGHEGNCLVNHPWTDERAPYHTYWETEMIGVEVLVGLLSDMYQIKVGGLHIRKSTMWILDLIKSRQVTPLRQLFVVQDMIQSLTEEDLEQILTNSRCKADHVNFIASLLFDLEKINYTIGNFKGLDFYDAPWMTVDILLTLGETCQEITIRKSKLNTLNLKEIMEHWLDGRMKSIKYLKVTADGFWRERLGFMGAIAKYETTLTGNGHYESYHGSVFSFNGGMGCKREDGGFIKLQFFRDEDILGLLFFTE